MKKKIKVVLEQRGIDGDNFYVAQMLNAIEFSPYGCNPVRLGTFIKSPVAKALCEDKRVEVVVHALKDS